MDWGSEPNIYVIGGAEGPGLALVREILNRGAFMVGVLDGIGANTEAVDALGDAVWSVQYDLSFSCPDIFTESIVFHTAYSRLEDPLAGLQSNLRMGQNIVQALTAACYLDRPPKLAAYIPSTRVDLVTRMAIGWLFEHLHLSHGVDVLSTITYNLKDSVLACAVCNLVESVVK